jgi:hypothetical protein
MYEVSRVSQLTAAGKNPLGAGASGAALDAQYDIENEGHSQLELGYARFWCDVGRLCLEAAQDMAEDEEFLDSELHWGSGSSLQTKRWRDIMADLDVEGDSFELHLEASGFLPSTRVGKIRAVEQLVANGFIDPKWAGSLMADFPDLKRAMLVENAPVEWVLWAMDKIADAELNEDETEVIEDKSAPIPAPDPHLDLDWVMGVAKAVYLNQMSEDDPQPILDRYTNFIDSVDAEMKKLKPAAPAPMPGDPMAMGGAPPPAGLSPDPSALPPAMPAMGVA